MAWASEVGVYALENTLARNIRIAGIEAPGRNSNYLKSGHLEELGGEPSLIAG